MTTTQYVGARYVPLFMGEWDNTQTYEPLCIVSNHGNSYTSRQYVPSGISLNNEEYWALTGNYNAQIEQYRKITELNTQSIKSINNVIKNVSRTYKTVEEMRADKNISAGIVKAQSFYTGDNGGSYYNIIMCFSPQCVNNITCQNVYYATFIQTSSEIYPEQLGAQANT